MFSLGDVKSTRVTREDFRSDAWGLLPFVAVEEARRAWVLGLLGADSRESVRDALLVEFLNMGGAQRSMLMDAVTDLLRPNMGGQYRLPETKWFEGEDALLMPDARVLVPEKDFVWGSTRLSEVIIRVLACHPIYSIRARLFSYEHLTLEHVRWFERHCGESFLSDLMENPFLPEGVLREMLCSTPRVWDGLAGNVRLPADCFDSLVGKAARRSSLLIRLLHNPSLPRSALMRLVEHEDELVRSLVFGNAAFSAEDELRLLTLESREWILASLAANSFVHEGTLLRLAAWDGVEVRSAVASHPRVPAGAVPEVMRFVPSALQLVTNGGVSSEILELALRSFDACPWGQYETRDGGSARSHALLQIADHPRVTRELLLRVRELGCEDVGLLRAVNVRLARLGRRSA